MSHQDRQPDRRRRGPSGRLRRSMFGERARETGAHPRKIELDRDLIMAALFIAILLLGGTLAFVLSQQRQIGNQQDDINSAQGDINSALRRSASNQKKLDDTQHALERLERRDRLNAYQTAYRFCSRLNIDRAALQWIAGNQLPGLSRTPEGRVRLQRFALRYTHKLQRKGGAPILDCDPNASGKPARYQWPAAQERFIRRWDKGQLSPSEIGICRVKIADLTRPRACVKEER